MGPKGRRKPKNQSKGADNQGDVEEQVDFADPNNGQRPSANLLRVVATPPPENDDNNAGPSQSRAAKGVTFKMDQVTPGGANPGLQIEMHAINTPGDVALNADVDQEQIKPVVGVDVIGEDGQEAPHVAPNEEDYFAPKEDVFDNFAQWAEEGNMDCLTHTSQCCMKTARFARVEIGQRLARVGEVMEQRCARRNSRGFFIGSAVTFVIAFFVIACVIYIGLTSDAASVADPPGFSAAKQFVARNLIAGAVIFTIYGLIFLHIDNYIAYIVLFLVQCVPGMFVFLYYFYQTYFLNAFESMPTPGYVQALYVALLYIFWIATYLIKRDIQDHFNTVVKSAFLGVWCALFGGVIIGYTVYTACTTWDLNYAWGYRVINVISAPYVLLLALLWVYLHFRYFEPLLQQILREKRLREEREEELKLIDDGQEAQAANNNGNENGNENGNGNAQNVSSQQQAASLAAKGLLPDDDQVADDNAQPAMTVSQQRWMHQQQALGSAVVSDTDAEVDVGSGHDASARQKQSSALTNMRRYIQHYVFVLSSAVLGSTMLTMTILSILYVSSQLERQATEQRQTGVEPQIANPQAFYLSVFLIIVVPLVTIVGTGLVWSDGSHRAKLNFIPILGAMIPIIFAMPFAVVVDAFEGFRPLTNYFMLGPPAVAVYWITLIYLRINHWRFTMLLNTFLCLFLIVPLFYVMPLRLAHQYEDVGKDRAAWGFEIGLLIAGASIAALLALGDLFLSVARTWYYHFRRYYSSAQQSGGAAANNAAAAEGKKAEQDLDDFIKAERFDLSNVFKYDLENFGLWGNSFGYIITFTILVFMYYNKPVWVTPTQSGTLIGLEITVVFLFFASLVVLMLEIVPEAKKEELSFSEKVAALTGKHETAVLIDIQKKVKRTIMHIGFLDGPVLFLILIGVYSGNTEMQWNFGVAVIGFYAVTFVFLLFYELKKQFEEYSKTFVPALVVFCWIFLYLPFTGIIPVSFMYLSVDREDLVPQQRMVFACIFLLLLVGLMLFALIMHMFFRRREFEKKFKFIACKVIKKLAKSHVKSDFAVIGLAYQGYVSLGPRRLRAAMRDTRKPIYWGPISKFDPNMAFSKMLIDFTTWQNLREQDSPPPTYLDTALSYMFLFCCCYRDAYDKLRTQIAPEDVNALRDINVRDAEDLLLRAQDAAHAQNVKELEDEEFERQEEPNSWLKDYILNINRQFFDARIIEPLRRYDLPQNLHISKPWTQQFLQIVFRLFAQGAKSRFPVPWIDYLMFKSLIELSGLSPSRDFPEELIDKIYGKFTAFDRVGNQQPITEDKFVPLLAKIAAVKYPHEPPEDAVGKLIKYFMFPHLLWYMVPLHGLYPHEWDYVLFLLRYWGQNETYHKVIQHDIYFRRALEKELGILPLDAQNLNPDIDQNLERERWTLRKLCEAIVDWWKEFCENLLYFVKSFCLLEKHQRNEGIDDVELEVKLVKDTILKTKPLLNKRRKEFQHPESPEWPAIVDILVDEMQEQEREWMRLKDDEFKNMRIRSNLTNTFAICFKIIEIATLATLAFRKDLEWNIGFTGLWVLNITNTFIPPQVYTYFFEISIIATAVFLFFTYRSVLRIRNLSYGNSESKGKNSGIFSRDFVYIQIVHFIWFVMLFFIAKTFMDTFSCDYAVKPRVLYVDPELVCFNKQHRDYFGLSIVGLVVLYPLGAFLFPNMQFQNKSLDLKYESTYLVISASIRFLIAGASAFWGYTDGRLYMFAFCAALLFLQAILTRLMKPCLVKKVNPLEMGGYLIAGWFHISAIVNLYTSIFWGWICLIIGSFVIIMVALGFFKIVYDRQRESAMRRKRRVINDKGEEVFITEDDPSDDENAEGDDEDDDKKKQEQEESVEFKIWKALNDFKLKKEMAGEWPEENHKPLLPVQDIDADFDDFEAQRLRAPDSHLRPGGDELELQISQQPIVMRHTEAVQKQKTPEPSLQKQPTPNQQQQQVIEMQQFQGNQQQDSGRPVSPGQNYDQDDMDEGVQQKKQKVPAKKKRRR